LGAAVTVSDFAGADVTPGVCVVGEDEGDEAREYEHPVMARQVTGV